MRKVLSKINIKGTTRLLGRNVQNLDDPTKERLKKLLGSYVKIQPPLQSSTGHIISPESAGSNSKELQVPVKSESAVKQSPFSSTPAARL